MMLHTKLNENAASLGILLLRLVSGGVMLTHGYSKLLKIATLKTSFPDPMGVGNELSFYLVLFAELVCAALVTLGLFTRIALIPLIATMVVAFFIIHAKDSLGDKELALFYMTIYTALLLTGSGKFSLDKLLLKK